MSRAVLACCLIAGCGAAPGPGPSATISQFANALAQGDARSSWTLLDEDARRGRTAEQHAALFEQNRTELAGVGRALEHQATGVQARASIPLASGERVVLVLEADGWHIDGGVIDAIGLATPLDAVGALRRALMRRDLAGLETVLARQTRAEWEDEIRRLLEATSDPADFELDVEGNRAMVRTTGGGTIELVRESGGWHVVDVRPP